MSSAYYQAIRVNTLKSKRKEDPQQQETIHAAIPGVFRKLETQLRDLSSKIDELKNKFDESKPTLE